MRRRRPSIDSLFLFLVLATPLIVVPSMQAGWEIGKMLWFWMVVELWLWVRLLTLSRLYRGNARLNIIFGIWMALFFISSLINGGDALLGGWWRRQGAMMFVHLGLLWYLVSTSDISQVYMKRAVAAFCSAITLIGLFFIHGGITLQSSLFFRPDIRLVGTVGEPNSWALFAVLAVLILVKTKSKARWLVLIFIPGILLSLSRTALLVLGLLLPFKRLFRPVAQAKRVVFYFAVFAAMALLLVGGIGLITVQRGWGDRLTLWSETLSMWQSRPIFGVGLDNFQSTLIQQTKNRGLQWIFYDQPHNFPLWLLVSTGLAGFVSFVVWIYFVFRQPGRGVWKILTSAVLLFGLFQPFLTPVWVYFFLILGVICQVPQRSDIVADENPSSGSTIELFRKIWIIVLASAVFVGVTLPVFQPYF